MKIDEQINQQNRRKRLQIKQLEDWELEKTEIRIFGEWKLHPLKKYSDEIIKNKSGDI